MLFYIMRNDKVSGSVGKPAAVGDPKKRSGIFWLPIMRQGIWSKNDYGVARCSKALSYYDNSSP